VGRQSFIQYFTVYARVKGFQVKAEVLGSITEEHSWRRVFSYSHATPAINLSPLRTTPAIFFITGVKYTGDKTVGRISVCTHLEINALEKIFL
jgi:hypothetical protein